MFLNGDLDILHLLATGPLNVGYQCCEIPGWDPLAVKLVHWPRCYPQKPHGILGGQGRWVPFLLLYSVYVKQKSRDKRFA